MSATLIVPILTGKVFEAFKAKSIGLDYFSTDFGKNSSGFAQPVKFGQEVISQLASVPKVQRTTPGGLMGTAQSSTGLVTDLRVAVDRMASSTIMLPSQDIEQLLAMPAFMQGLSETGQALGRFVVQDAIGCAVSGNNFTNVITAPAPDLDTLETGRAQLNAQLALAPRFGVGTTNFLGKIGSDPRVLYTYGYNQKVEAGPYLRFQNLKGFNEVSELPSFPNGNQTLATFTAVFATGIFTIAALAASSDPTTGNATSLDPIYNFYNGMRVQVSSTGNIPTGLTANNYYYVTGYTPLTQSTGVVGGTGAGGTFQLANTVGGAAVAITDNGSGTLTLTQAENTEAFLFERRAIHIATRPMIDPTEAAAKLGIPSPILVQRQTDPETGLDFLVFIWQDVLGANPTLNIYASFVVQFGVRAGRGIQANLASGVTDPTSFAANTGMDRAGLRVITA